MPRVRVCRQSMRSGCSAWPSVISPSASSLQKRAGERLAASGLRSVGRKTPGSPDPELTDEKAVLRAEWFARDNPLACTFSPLLKRGKGGHSAITVGNLQKWRAIWKPNRRGKGCSDQWWCLADRVLTRTPRSIARLGSRSSKAIPGIGTIWPWSTNASSAPRSGILARDGPQGRAGRVGRVAVLPAGAHVLPRPPSRQTGRARAPFRARLHLQRGRVPRTARLV